MPVELFGSGLLVCGGGSLVNPKNSFKTKGLREEYGIYFGRKSQLEAFDGTPTGYQEENGSENAWLTTTVYFVSYFSGFSDKGGRKPLKIRWIFRSAH